MLTKAVKRENATKLDLFVGEKNEFPLLPTSLENLLLGKVPGAVRGERCSLFLALRCLGKIDDENDFFAPNRQNRVLQRCFGAKYQFLFRSCTHVPGRMSMLAVLTKGSVSETF